jgi:hypothetical protein
MNEQKKTKRSMYRVTQLVCFVAISCVNAMAASVGYISRQDSHSLARQQIEVAAGFYGLDINVATLEKNGDVPSAMRLIEDPKTVAVVLDADALSKLSYSAVLGSLRKRETKIPLLIAGIDDHTSSELLMSWSDGLVSGCQKASRLQSVGQYNIGNVRGVTGQLTGTKLPLHQGDVFSLDARGLVQHIVDAQLGSGPVPTFLRMVHGGQDLFFAANEPGDNIPATPDPYRQQGVFAMLAPQMIFLRFAGGERVWHSPGDYANFTIDDLWLREPYGHVDYESLLQHSQQHNFHTTIAFIPWNFDRSQPRMVSLFRDHPDRLSVSIHGNNHIHQEFGPLESHPLDKQEVDIAQARARMEKFSELTRIPYDAVMVFPHSISPEATFSALKRANYLATANSLSVPSDADTPSDAEFALRTASLHFATFPSLRRYSAESDIPEAQLAIDAFLGNPMLFYAHESFFASGMDAFDKTADVVNRIQPDTKWRGLGDIAQHLYLEKLRDDNNFDVRMYSNSVRLTNNQDRDATFFLEKDEDFAFPLAVFVDGQPFAFMKSGSGLRLNVPVAAGVSRLIEIRYEGGANVAGVDISKNSVRTTAIRLLSDFRDNFVSNTAAGRWFIRSYVDYGRDWNRAMAFIAVLAASVITAWYVRRRKRGALSELKPPVSY